MHPSNDKMETVQHKVVKSRELSKPFYYASSIVPLNWLLQLVFVKEKLLWSPMKYPSSVSTIICFSCSVECGLQIKPVTELLINPFRNLL